MTVIVEYFADCTRSGKVRLSRSVDYGKKDSHSDYNWYTVSSAQIQISASDALDIVAFCRNWIDGKQALVFNDLTVQSADPAGDSIGYIKVFTRAICGVKCFLSWTSDFKVYTDVLSSDWAEKLIKEIESAAKTAIDANKRRGELLE